MSSTICKARRKPVQKQSPVVVDMTMSPHPIGSHEATLARIARRAVGGKVAMVERGSRTAMVVNVNPEDDGVVEGDIVQLEQHGSKG